MRILTALLGRENTTSPELKSLGELFGKASLIGKKAAFFADERLDKGTSNLVSWLLKISGEDDVTIPRKHIGDWIGRLPTRIWMGTNVTPQFDDPSGVITNRFILFLLTQSFFGREETGLEAKLMAELSGILNWALAGLAMLRKDGAFIQPEESKETIARMAGIAAPVLLFAREQLIIGEERSVARDTLVLNYRAWCEKAGNNPQGRAKFFDTLIGEYPGIEPPRRVGKRGEKPVWMVFGVGLRTDADDQEILLPDNEDPGSARVVNLDRTKRPG